MAEDEQIPDVPEIDEELGRRLGETGQDGQRLRESLPEEDKPRFDEAREEYNAAMRDYFQKVAREIPPHDPDSIETAAQALVDAMIHEQESVSEGDTSEDVVARLHRMARAIEALPVPRKG